MTGPVRKRIHDQPARPRPGAQAIPRSTRALGRLASDDYGYCEGCGGEIGLRRLEARPTAELCIDCKHLEEEKEKARRRERSTESATVIARTHRHFDHAVDAAPATRHASARRVEPFAEIAWNWVRCGQTWKSHKLC